MIETFCSFFCTYVCKFYLLTLLQRFVSTFRSFKNCEKGKSSYISFNNYPFCIQTLCKETRVSLKLTYYLNRKMLFVILNKKIINI